MKVTDTADTAAGDPHTFTYAWQCRSGDFLHWMLPTLISGLPKDTVDALVQATDRWRDVTLTIQVNGVPVPVKAFLDGIERNLDHLTVREASRLLDEGARFDALADLVHDVEREVVKTVRARLASAGVEIPRDDD